MGAAVTLTELQALIETKLGHPVSCDGVSICTRCPAHLGDRADCMAAINAVGRPIFSCSVGCPPDTVAAALGLAPHVPSGLLTRASRIRARSVSWLWPGYLPTGCVVMLYGDGGLGKSTICLDWLARVSSGRGMPGSGATEPGDVAYLAAEDDGGELAKRLSAIDADLDRVHVGGVMSADLICEIIAAHRMTVLDPITAYTGDADINAHEQVRPILQGMVRAVSGTGGVVILVHHTNKSGGYLGSSAWQNVVRSSMLLTHDVTGVGSLILCRTKGNYSREPAPWRLTLRDAGVEYMGQVTGVDHSDYLASPYDQRRLRHACAWLRDRLPMSEPALMKAAPACGIDRSILDWAGRLLGVRHTRDAGMNPVWRL